MKKPLVTVAIPTYQRPQLLKRALDSLLEQDYENFEVLISDNGTDGGAVEKIISEYKNKFLNLNFYKQKENIGALKNCFFLLDRAKGDYFMWLADDDEISHGYITHLVKMILENPKANVVSANWYLIDNFNSGYLMPRVEISSHIWFMRAMKYLWSGRDYFFYGLHRTEKLKKATFDGYRWPNQFELRNWAFVYLFDLVLDGQVLISENYNIRYINHSYELKTYIKKDKILIKFICFILRRMNVNELYFKKVLKKMGLVRAVMFFPILIVTELNHFFTVFRKKVI